MPKKAYYQDYIKEKVYDVYLEKYKIHVLIKLPDKKNSLDSLIENIEKELKDGIDSKSKLEQTILRDYKKLIDFHSSIKKQYTKNTIDSATGVQIFYVPSSALPKNVLGMYVPSTRTIYIANDLPNNVERFVYHHEIAHAKGIKDESLADNYAASIVGFNLRQAA